MTAVRMSLLLLVAALPLSAQEPLVLKPGTGFVVKQIQRSAGKTTDKLWVTFDWTEVAA